MVIIKKIIISGYYGFNNLGDEAILAAWVQGLKSDAKSEEIKIIALSDKPEKTAQEYGITAIGRYNIFSLIRHLFSTDLFISGGGGLLQDVTGKFSPSYYLALIVLAKILGCKTFFAAQGVGPIKARLNRYLTAVVLNRVDRLTVRDREAKKLLVKSGVKQKIAITADLALSLGQGSEKRGVKLLQEEGIFSKEAIWGVVVRQWQQNDYLPKLAQVLNSLEKSYQFKLVIIPFKVPGDYEVSYQLEELLDFPAQLIKRDYSPLEMMDIIKPLNFLIGVRLHALIFASLNRVVAAGIAYDPKINNFLARIKQEAVADIDCLEVEAAKKRMIKLWEQKESFLAKKEKKIADLAGLSRRNLEIALRLVGINGRKS